MTARAARTGEGAASRHSTHWHAVLCKFCSTSGVVKNGTRKGTQYWLCRNCGRGFVDNHALPGRKYPLNIVIAAFHAFWRGSSVNEIRDLVEQETRMRPAISAVYRWIVEMDRFSVDLSSKYKPRLGDVWKVRGDEVLKLGDTRYRLLYLMDSKTRFAVSARLSRTCNSGDIRRLLESAYIRTGLIPGEIVMNGKLGACTGGIEIAFGGDSRRVEVSVSTCDDSERMSWRRARKSTGLMESTRTPRMVRGRLPRSLFVHNFLRRRECLGNRTPAEAAGIEFPYKTLKDVIRALHDQVVDAGERHEGRRTRADVVGRL